MRLHKTGRFLGYIDLHAHAGHKGVFIYGNQLPQLKQHIQNCIIPKLICLYSSIFDYDGCNFTEKNMYAADKGDGLSKEGSGRVALYKACGIIHSYTLECNYNIGKITNFIYQESQDDSYKHNTLDQNIVLGSFQTTIPQSNFYTIADFEQVGVAIVNAFLDFNLLNPKSCLSTSPFKNLANLKTYLAYNIIKSTAIRYDPYMKKILKYCYVNSYSCIIYKRDNQELVVKQSNQSIFIYTEVDSINLEQVHLNEIKLISLAISQLSTTYCTYQPTPLTIKDHQIVTI